MSSFFSSIEQAIATLQAGKMILLLDDEDRENEGDLVLAADFVTPAAINFMAQFGRGLICLPMAPHLIDKLQLPMMTGNNQSVYKTGFTISIEAACGVTSGISAADRAHTIQVAINPKSAPSDLVSPGHVFPLRAKEKGVLERAGQTEGSVDLMKLAGLTPAAVICEVMNPDGSMSRQNDLILFAQQHDIPLITIRALIDYRVKNEQLVNAEASATIPIGMHGDFVMTVFTSSLDDAEHVALVKSPKVTNQVPLVRIHSECITGDVFGSGKCDCGWQLQQALSQLAEEGGILIYLRQEGRGIGLVNKIKAYTLQEKGYDTVEANLELGFPPDKRDYAVAFQILNYLGVEVVRLLTNNPQKIEALEKYGLIVSERISLASVPSSTNRHYLKTKQQKLKHFLAID